jgi:hypothetical protein
VAVRKSLFSRPLGGRNVFGVEPPDSAAIPEPVPALPIFLIHLAEISARLSRQLSTGL